jgi:hypothetical protein
MLGVPWQLHGNVFVRLARITNTGFAMLGDQLIEALACLHALFNHLLDQVLFELSIFSVKIVTVITRKNAGSVFYIGAHMISRR